MQAYTLLALKPKILCASVLTPAIVFSLIGCGNDAEVQDEYSGEIELAMAPAPSGVQCLRLSIVGLTRSVERKLALSAGQPTSTRLPALPSGSVTVEAAAFAEACDQVADSSIALWVSDPRLIPLQLSAGVPTLLQILLRPNAIMDVTVAWQDDSTLACPETTTIVPLDALAMSPGGMRGLRAVYNDGTAIDGEAPIFHGYTSEGTYYQGELGLWAGKWDGWGVFEVTLSVYIYAPMTATYTLTTEQDVYGKLTVDDKVLYEIDNSSWYASAEVAMVAGSWHSIRIDYMNRWGSNRLSLSWQCER